MNKKYRLVSITKSEDNLTKEEIEIYEMNEVKYNSTTTEYYFTTNNSSENSFFILSKQDINTYQFHLKKTEIIEVDLTEFEQILIKSDEGIRRTFFSKNLNNRRKNKDSWASFSQAIVETDQKLGFEFTHIEEANFEYGPNFDNDNSDLIATRYSDTELTEQLNYIIIDKEKVELGFKTINGIAVRINGNVKEIEYNENGSIKKIETYSNFNLGNYPVRYEFDSNTLNPLEKSNRNAIITVFGKDETEIPIRTQISLLFGRFMGEVNFG